MRVPVYSSDLTSKCSFKRLAKQLQKQWPGPNPIQLSFAQEVLAQGLGYRDFHDMRESGNRCPKDAFTTPPQTLVRDSITQAICQASRATKVDKIDLSSASALVATLPLYVLTAFANPPAKANTSLSLIPTTYIATDKMAKRIITENELGSIAERLKAKGKLRDWIMFELLCAGMRGREILSLVVGRSHHSGISIVSNPSSTILFKPSAMKTFSPFIQNILEGYIRENGLVQNNPLFSLKHSSNVALTPSALYKTVTSWGEDETFNLNLTPHVIRVSAITHLSNFKKINPQHFLKHIPLMLTEAYMSK